MIFIQDIKKGIYFQAGDQSLLCELLHPDRPGMPLQMGFSLAHAKVKPGQSTLTHELSTSSEIYYILEGEGVIHIEQESTPYTPVRSYIFRPILNNTSKIPAILI